MANAMEAKGNCWLQVENGLVDGRDGWNRSKVTPLDKWPSGRVTAMMSWASVYLGLGVRNDLWVTHPKEKQEHHFETRGHRPSKEVCLSG